MQLHETASGYALFKVNLADDIAPESFYTSISDLSKFGKIATLLSFSPFKSAAQALENINDVSEGIVNDHLKSLLDLNLGGKKKGIRDASGVDCDVSESSLEVIRGIRLHSHKLLKGMEENDFKAAQLGLGHSYSRSKLKFNVNRIDNMIIQAIALLDQLDKDVNLFSMRVREWYGYHFPELVKLVPDNYQYARAAQFIGDKETLNEEKIPDLTELLEDDETTARNVLDAARGSMGSALNEVDMLNIMTFATRVISIADYRKSLITYLTEKMNLVAPSLTALLGERIAARLISHAGSLTNLSKYPASTVQILGAEKALFRALKTKGNTPKYGLLYHSSFIGRAGPKHKGRISRFLANKCSIASRIDCYSDVPTSKFGEALRGQVEERLNFFETGEAPKKNAETMQKVVDELRDLMDVDEDEEDEEDEDEKPSKSTLKMGGLERMDVTPEKKSKKDKKDKKSKKRKADEMDVDESEEPEESPEPVPKKVKLSKEEKKALKKEKKKAAKAEAAKGSGKKEKKEKKKKDKGAKVTT
ncbi:Nop-domain-containing protein [Flagelloscypha sp. PMI_526]|nr:Nop-domain-containing protein [Flagelloscypha sp. PMI_526]